MRPADADSAELQPFKAKVLAKLKGPEEESVIYLKKVANEITRLLSDDVYDIYNELIEMPSMTLLTAQKNYVKYKMLSILNKTHTRIQTVI